MLSDNMPSFHMQWSLVADWSKLKGLDHTGIQTPTPKLKSGLVVRQVGTEEE